MFRKRNEVSACSREEAGTQEEDAVTAAATTDTTVTVKFYWSKIFGSTGSVRIGQDMLTRLKTILKPFCLKSAEKLKRRSARLLRYG